MADLDTREWLLTNGLGSFASGTVSDARTRTYHGWLIAAVDPPSQRTLLLSHIEASLEIAGFVVALGTNFWGNGKVEPTGFKLLQSFAIEPVPTWIWSQDCWQLSRQLVMPDGRQKAEAQTCGAGVSPHPQRGPQSPPVEQSLQEGRTTALREFPPLKQVAWQKDESIQPENRILIQYRYEGSEVGILRLRPLIGDRNFHHQQQQAPDLQFSQLVGQQHVCLQAIRPEQVGTAWELRWTRGEYQADTVWYWNYQLPEETKRGLGDREDLYSPGYLTIILEPGAVLTLEARVGLPDSTPPLSDSDFEQAVQTEQKRLYDDFRLPILDFRLGNTAQSSETVKPNEQPNNPKSKLLVSDRQHSTQNPKSKIQNPKFQLWQQLLRAGDQFIVYRASIAAPTVIAGYHWFNDWGRDTLIALPGLALTTQRYDLAKELLQTFGFYCRYGLIPNTFPDVGAEPIYNSIDAALWWIETLGLYLEATQDWNFLAEQYPVVQQIYKAFTAGTKYNIQVDATDGLLSWDAPGVALTWMDVVIDGQPITPRRGKPVEINALWYSALCWASDWAERLSQAGFGEGVRLSNQARRYEQQAQQVKASLQKFWNPTAGYFYDTIEPDDRPNAQIRPNAVIALSLHHCGFPATQADKVLQLARQRLLTPFGLRSLAPDDPQYVGRYGGDRYQRDYAYHQGTVWSWLIGPFIRAWKRFHGCEPVPFDWQPLLNHFQHQACIGSISEIFDGDAPHSPQGAIAQAWSVAELIRHWDDIE